MPYFPTEHNPKIKKDTLGYSVVRPNNSNRYILNTIPKIRGIIPVLQNIRGVYGLFFVGSDVVGLSLNNGSDIDVAVFVDPARYDSVAREIKQKFRNWVVLGEREDGIPYVLHKGDIDLLIVPALKQITPDLSFKPINKAIDLRNALRLSPVSRTIFHRRYLESLSPKTKKELLDVKKEWKKLGLWRSGISTIQLAILLRDAKKRGLSVTEFIQSPIFEKWVNNVEDPSDPKRKLWASLTNAPWEMELFKVWAKNRDKVKSRHDLYALIDNSYKVLSTEYTLPKNKVSRVINLAKRLSRIASTYGYSMKIIDADLQKNNLFIVYSLKKMAQPIKVELITQTEKGKNALLKYITQGRLYSDATLKNKIKDVNNLPPIVYKEPTKTQKEMEGILKNKFFEEIRKWK